jgi:hypothetical protein
VTPDHSGKLVLVLGRLENTGHDTDLSARHRKRVHSIRLEDRHFPIEVPVFGLQLQDDGLGDAMDIVDFRAIRYFISANWRADSTASS